MITVEKILPDGVIADDDGEALRIPSSDIDKFGELRLGNVLVRCGGRYSLSRELSDKRHEDILALQNELWDD